MNKLIDGLYIIWAIATKDVVDAIKNRIVIRFIVAICLLILLPDILAWAIDPPYTDVVVYDLGKSSLVDTLDEATQFRVQKADSMQELTVHLYNTIESKLGLVIPADYDSTWLSGDVPELAGYITWEDRSKAQELQTEMENRLKELGMPVSIQIANQYIYPPIGNSLYSSLLTLNTVVVLMMICILLIPNLMIEEKQTRSIDALLVSPASIRQVIAGKALAGLFYILIASVVVFVLNWSAVVHWEIAILFTWGVGLFTAAAGLVIGNIFERQQDTIGAITAFMVILLGALFLDIIEIGAPTVVETLIQWMPSVALAKIFEFTFLEFVDWVAVWNNLGIVLLTSAPFYALAIWQVRRMDR